MKHLPSIALLTTTTTFSISTAVDVASEVKSILNDTIVNLTGGGGSSKVEATADGLMQMFTALSTAASLSIFFFKYLIGFMMTTTKFLLSPILWLSNTCWNQFVMKPVNLFLHVLHVFYPVIMFCLAAICCGLFIGGCAGFAAEAFSSLLTSATWGSQAAGTGKNTEPAHYVESVITHENEDSDDSQDKPPILFGSSTNKKGKEPLIPRVESWRDSLSSTSSSPVLIRRMKLSSTDRKDSWEWDEQEEDTEEEEIEFKSFIK